MSGGAFDYNQYKIGYIADEVEQLIRENGKHEIDEYGDNVGHFYSEETIEKFMEAEKTLRRAQVMAQRIDWLVCGDDGEDSFHRRWHEELQKIGD